MFAHVCVRKHWWWSSCSYVIAKKLCQIFWRAVIETWMDFNLSNGVFSLFQVAPYSILKSSDEQCTQFRLHINTKEPPTCLPTFSPPIFLQVCVLTHTEKPRITLVFILILSYCSLGSACLMHLWVCCSQGSALLDITSGGNMTVSR